MKVVCSILMMLFCFLSRGQSSLFGDKCIGQWQGTMMLYNQGQLKDSVKVNLHIEKLSPTSWTWKTEYLSETMPLVKDYVLRAADSIGYKFVLDEGGGLELTDYLFGNKLYSVFETMGVFLTSTYELNGDSLTFEVTSGKKETITHPDVITYSTGNLQRVVFKRIKR